MGVPLYMSKYSRRDFTVHQHLLMLGVKELEKTSFRGLLDCIDDLSLQDDLPLKKVPHYTTPQKFLSRVNPLWFLRLLFLLVSQLKSSFKGVFDATGFRPSKASLHYIQRIGRIVKKREYLKGLFAVDHPTGLIISCWAMNGRYHESPRLWRLVDRVPGVLKEGTGDKGFDSEANQQLIASRNSRSYIDVRRVPRRGRLRKAIFRFKTKYPARWKKAYRKRRNIIESFNAAFKRLFGESIPGRTVWSQKKYLYIRCIFYNFYKKNKNHSFFILEVFYKPI